MGGGPCYKCDLCDALCHIKCINLTPTPKADPIKKSDEKKQERAPKNPTSHDQKNNLRTPFKKTEPQKDFSDLRQLQTIINKAKGQRAFISCVLFIYDTFPLTGQG